MNKEYLIAIKAAFTLLTLGVINPTENSKQLLIEVKNQIINNCFILTQLLVDSNFLKGIVEKLDIICFKISLSHPYVSNILRVNTAISSACKISNKKLKYTR